jgi:hypothetical protein
VCVCGGGGVCVCVCVWGGVGGGGGGIVGVGGGVVLGRSCSNEHIEGEETLGVVGCCGCCWYWCCECWARECRKLTRGANRAKRRKCLVHRDASEHSVGNKRAEQIKTGQRCTGKMRASVRSATQKSSSKRTSASRAIEKSRATEEQ